MTKEELKTSDGPVRFKDVPGSCAVGWMHDFPYSHFNEAYDAAALEKLPAEIKKAEELGPSYEGCRYRQGWLCVLSSAQQEARKVVESCGYVLIARCKRAHDSGDMELWGKGFELPEREGVVEKKPKKAAA